MGLHPGIRLLLLCLFFLADCWACKRMPGWQEKTTADVLSSSELTIVGSMTGHSSVTQPDGFLHVKFHTAITCVLTNTRHLHLRPIINITSVQYGSFGNANSCEKAYIGEVRYDVDVVILLRPFVMTPGEFSFNRENFQGPFFYWNDTAGGTVPAQCAEAGRVRSLRPVGLVTSGGKTRPAMSIVLLSLLTAGRLCLGS